MSANDCNQDGQPALPRSHGSAIGHCADCRHFHRHREIVRGPYWSDELMEVDSMAGDCRCEAPKVHWLTGNAVWPVVTTGHSCSRYSPNDCRIEFRVFKGVWLLLAAVLLLCGCTVTQVNGPNWTLRRTSFLQRVDFDSVSIATNGVAEIKGYHADGGQEALSKWLAELIRLALERSVRP